MIRKLLLHPKEVLVLLVGFALLGLYLGSRLPVALYPNSSKPAYRINIGTDNLTPRSFYNQYYGSIEQLIREIEGVEQVRFSSQRNMVRFEIDFKWGVDGKRVDRDINAAVNSIKALLPTNLQDRVNLRAMAGNSGFFAASITSPDGDLAGLKRALDPILMPYLNKIDGVEEIGVFDPRERDVYITIQPDALILHRVSLGSLTKFISETVSEQNAGNMRIDEKSFSVIVKNEAMDLEALRELSLGNIGRPGLRLKDVAQVDLATKPQGGQIFRSNGELSLILWAQPNDSGDLKAICDQIKDILIKTKEQWPKGSTYQVLVDPSEFISSAIMTVKEHVLVGGVLAVLILILFVGSIRLTIFSAIEIPLAIIWAFILMYIFDVTLNLVSLGGLALTAGMNIDASVVMVENIVRRAALDQPKTFQQRFDSILQAVNEVKMPIFISTLASVIVFVPLSLTSGITHAILGDLTKAVIFSHGFSAVVAIILVPILRLYFGSSEEKVPVFLQKFDHQFERFCAVYVQALRWVLSSKQRRQYFSLGVVAVFVFCLVVLAPLVRKEIVSLPKTDSIVIQTSSTNTRTTEQLAQNLRPFEQALRQKYGDKIKTVFTEMSQPDFAFSIVRLNDKSYAETALTEFPKVFPNSPEMNFRFDIFNPSKLPIPDVPDLTLSVTGSEDERHLATQMLERELRGTRKFQWVWSSTNSASNISLRPKTIYLENLAKAFSPSISMGEVGDMLHTMLTGKRLGYMNTEDGAKEIRLVYPQNLINSVEDLAAIPIVVGTHILPLKAIAEVREEMDFSSLYREEGSEFHKIKAYLKREYHDEKTKTLKKLESEIAQIKLPEGSRVITENADKEINDALTGLIIAFAMSLVLMGLVIYFQFGVLKDVLIVLTAVPLGLIGVSICLLAFNSPWSINSLLGVILLGGIAVNNSILLVSYYREGLEQGKDALTSALESCQVRLRPILITSLTTIFAMLPIALGIGEGSEVLQPLGIAVSGGLLFSTFLTLFFVPILEVSFVDSHNSTTPTRVIS